jgi:hypothetical protein
MYLKYHNLLNDIGKGPLSDKSRQDAELFICKLYNVPSATCDKARVKLFCKSKPPELLPPTSDAVKHHIERAHYQSMVWRQADSSEPELPSPTSLG